MPKEEDSFRVRFRKNKSGITHFLNPSCKECDSKEQRIRYKQLKDVPEFIAKNRERIKEYRAENLDKVLEKDRVRRQTDKHKQNRADYIKNNKSKILAQERVTKKKYKDRVIKNLEDVYVRSLLSSGTGLAKNEIPPALVKLKKMHLLCKRTLNIKKT